MADSLEKKPSGPNLFAGARRNWLQLLLFTAAVVGYWLLVFLTLYLSRGALPIYQILSRSLALVGATLIGWSLFSSLAIKWQPRFAPYWTLRRALGVAGFIFAAGHVWVVNSAYFNWNLELVYFSLNPFVNPLVFGSLAFPIFLLMTLTATDWAVARMGGPSWKFLQRFVYLAYLFTVFHFVLLAPDLFSHWPGIVLAVTTVGVLLGQLYWWYKISASRQFRNLGFWVGLGIIFLYLVFGYLAFKRLA
jgi:sulfoxide reductase heme-binding subunit YedZ